MILMALDAKARADMKTIFDNDTISIGIHIDGETGDLAQSNAAVSVKVSRK